MKRRDTYYDFLRGIAIFFVIGIHTYVDNTMHINLFLRQFLNCAVPIFLAISGYFIGSKQLDTRESYVTFLKKQIPRVYIPMLVWSMPWLLLYLYAQGSILKGILIVLVGGMSIFYFIPLIIQYYLLTPVIQKVNRCYGGVFRVNYCNRDYCI